MSAAPAVSVILPTYNRARLLPRAIASVLGQSFDDFELIVIDDGSKDGTAEVMRAIRDPRVIYLPPERNLGDAGARNRGIAGARGEWLAFQDSDDEWLPDKLRLQMEVARGLPADFAAVGGGLLRYTGDAVTRYGWPLLGAGAESLGGGLDGAGDGWGEVSRTEFIASFVAFLQSMLLRRSAFEALGGFDTRLKARSDFELCLRLAGRYRIAATTRVVAMSSEGISRRPDYRVNDIRRIVESHRELLDADAVTAGRYWYDLGKAELATGDSAAGRRALLHALRRRPGQLRAWGLLALSPFGAGAVNGITTLSLRAKQLLRQGSAAAPPKSNLQ
jgi:glycosyltransferase involved in cell wall biosynthesis